MNKILLIGNSGTRKQSLDGQTIKTRLYIKKILDEGYEVQFIDLENFIKHPISTLIKISKGIKVCDRIVLLAAERGSKNLIPYINWQNKKIKKPFVLPLIGTSVLHYSIDKLGNEEKNDFFCNSNYSLAKPNKRLSRQLSKISYILPETELICRVFREFYNLSNVYLLTNFRENSNVQNNKSYSNGESIKMIFVSRVMREKGIFDLLDVTNELINDGVNIELDIYGKLVLGNDLSLFQSLTSSNKIQYLGQVDNNNIKEILSKYNLFVFPTRFVSEGTPGVIVESLLAGTPVLTSNFPQVKYLLNNNFDSLWFNIFSKKDLKEKILLIYNGDVNLNSLRNGAKESGKRFTYYNNKEIFLRFVCGKNK